MNKRYLIPLTAAAGGAVALVLRWLQNANGFEYNTGLPIPGHPMGVALAVWLAALAVLLVLLTRRLPKESVFPEMFSASESTMLVPVVMGSLLFGVSGVMDAAALVSPSAGLLSGSFGMTPVTRVIFAATALIPAAVLFRTASACRHGSEAPTADGGEESETADTAHVYLLAVPVCMVVRLVLTYRVCSVNPSLEEYYISLLALVLLTLAFYRLSGCAFRAGDTRCFALYAAGATVLCITGLADRAELSQVLFLTAGAVTLLGFLLLRFSHRRTD